MLSNIPKCYWNWYDFNMYISVLFRFKKKSPFLISCFYLLLLSKHDTEMVILLRNTKVRLPHFENIEKESGMEESRKGLKAGNLEENIWMA